MPRRPRKPRIETGGNGRDGAGRFTPGCDPGPGRPPGPTIDFRSLVREKGGDVESALLAIYNKLVELAMAGDVRAAQVLLDRLCGRMPLAEVDQVEGPMRVLVVRTGVPARRSSTDPPHLRA